MLLGRLKPPFKGVGGDQLGDSKPHVTNARFTTQLSWGFLLPGVNKLSHERAGVNHREAGAERAGFDHRT